MRTVLEMRAIRKNSLPSSSERKTYRAVILTALSVEYRAARKHIAANIREQTHPRGTVYEIGKFRAAKADWEVCLVEVGIGNQAAAFEVERAIATFNPIVVIFLGVAGGIKDVSIGDVVFSTKVYGYESGRDAIEFLPRPDVGESTYALEQRARAEARKLDWISRIEELSPNFSPKVFLGAIAAGEKVLGSTRSATYRFLRETYSDALAVEMEGRGFLRAIRANGQVEAGVVRGISDLLDDKSAVEMEGTQEIASAHAAAFTFQLLDQFDVSPYVDRTDGLERSRVRYVVLISAEVDEQEVALAKAAFELLKKKVGDSTMVLERVEFGSIILFVQGAFSGFQRLSFFFKTGQLGEVGHFRISGMALLPTAESDIVHHSRERALTKKVRYKSTELESSNLPELYARLHAYGRGLISRYSRTGQWSDLDARDLVGEAITKYLSNDRVRPADLDLYIFLCGIMKQVLYSYLAKTPKEFHIGHLNEFSEADFVHDASLLPDARRSGLEMIALVQSVLRDKPQDLRIFELIVDGEKSSAIIAKMLNIPIREVESSRRRLRALVSALLDDRILMARHSL